MTINHKGPLFLIFFLDALLITYACDLMAS